MADGLRRSPVPVIDIAEELMASYEGRVPPATVSSIVSAANEDLTGQVPDDALPELLHRLSAARLSELVPAEAIRPHHSRGTDKRMNTSRFAGARGRMSIGCAGDGQARRIPGSGSR